MLKVSPIFDQCSLFAFNQIKSHRVFHRLESFLPLHDTTQNFPKMFNSFTWAFILHMPHHTLHHFFFILAFQLQHDHLYRDFKHINFPLFTVLSNWRILESKISHTRVASLITLNSSGILLTLLITTF